jgi:SAM-dependent methyltransferase
MYRIESCPVCSSKNIKFKENVIDRHYGNKGEFELNECPECDLVFLNPMFTDSELAKFYPSESYYAFNQASEESTKKKWTHTLYQILWLDFKKNNIKETKEKKVLDIGCGTGWELFKYKQKGWKVAGVEPSKAACDTGNKQGLNIFNGTLLDANFQENEFDLIISSHSFEHIPNPNETMMEIKRILKDGGELIMSIPNYAGLNSKIFGKYWYYLTEPVHTFLYSPKSIKKLFPLHGFEIRKIKYNGNMMGILGSLQSYKNRKNGKMADDGNLTKSFVWTFLATHFSKIENLFRKGDCISIIAKKK